MRVLQRHMNATELRAVEELQNWALRSVLRLHKDWTYTKHGTYIVKVIFNMFLGSSIVTSPYWKVWNGMFVCPIRIMKM